MSNKNNFQIEDWIVPIVLALTVGLGVFLVIEFGQYVLAPLFTAANAYFANYGRATAEVFTLIAITRLGLSFYSKTLKEMASNFVQHADKLQNKILNLSDGNAFLEKEIEKHKLEIKSYAKNQEQFESKIKLLRSEVLAHQTEIERLKNPEAVARREQIESQKSNDENLKAIAESIRWGAPNG